ncbi:hypothetical protein EDC04DRAFT_2566855, partial [Pisolithus marmoratus]
IDPALVEDTTRIRYDVRQPPSHSLLPRVPQLGGTLALSPPSSAMRIIPHSFPWSLDISAPVTCATVFEALYEKLQKLMADSEIVLSAREESARMTQQTCRYPCPRIIVLLSYDPYLTHIKY